MDKFWQIINRIYWWVPLWHSDCILISRGCYEWRSSSLSRYCRKFRRMKNKIKLRALKSQNLMPVFHTCLRASVWSKNKGEAAGPGGQSPGFATVLVCCINQHWNCTLFVVELSASDESLWNFCYPRKMKWNWNCFFTHEAPKSSYELV